MFLNPAKPRSAGFTLIELVAVVVILGALVVVSVPFFLDLRSEAQSAVYSYNDGSVGQRVMSASFENAARGQAHVAGTRKAKWEYSCMAGNNIAQLLDDPRFEGGYGSMYFTKADGSEDTSRPYWILSGDESITDGEFKICTATPSGFPAGRPGTTFTFMLYGCSANCDCNTYPSSCTTY